nr:MAG TPA: hypothetical protein [Caudoviricetes sp.]
MRICKPQISLWRNPHKSASAHLSFPSFQYFFNAPIDNDV